MCNSSDLILDTGFSIGFILEKLIKSGKLDENGLDLSNLAQFRAEKSDAPAFMSNIVKLTFVWKNGNPIGSVILKNPGKLDNQDRAVEYLKYAHTRECQFYELFAESPLQLRLARFFYGHPYDTHHNEGLIVMQDLSPTTMTVQMLPGFSNQQTESVVREMARIHAASWLESGWIKVFGGMPDGVTLFIGECYEVAQELRSIKGEVFGPLLDRMKPFYDQSYFLNCFYTTSKYGIPACCVHSDLWAANLMWQVDSQGEPTDRLEAIIDWQTAHAGNPGEDLVRLLAMNNSSAYRHSETDRLLRLYHETVNDLLGKELFSLAQLKEACDASLAYVSVVASFGAPLYCKMEKVTGGPNGAQLKAELLNRVQCLFEDALKANNL